LGSWLRACRTNGHDICQGVGLVSSSGVKGCPTLFPWHEHNNDDSKILCKTGHACTYVDTQASSFCGHVTLGLRIHDFSYLSQPSVSKICSFINSYIYPSLFWAFGKIFTTFTLQVHTHFFNKAFVSWSVKPKVISFQKHVGFLVNRFYFYFIFLFDKVDICDHTFFFLSKKSCERGYARPTYVKIQRQSNRRNAMISRNKKPWQNKLRAVMSDHSGSKHNNWKQ